METSTAGTRRLCHVICLLLVTVSWTGMAWANECSGQGDIIFLVDDSEATKLLEGSSVVYASGIATFLQQAVSTVSLGNVRVGITLISSSARRQIVFSDNLAALQAAINGITPQWQSLNTFTGIQNVVSQFTDARAGVPKILVIVTNGVSSNPTLTIAEASTARAAGIEIFGVSFLGDVPVPELNAITGNTSLVFVSPSASDLSGIFASLNTAVCTSIAASQPTSAGCSQNDIIILLDDSEATKAIEGSSVVFPSGIQSFLTTFINTVSLGATRVGITQVSNTVRQLITFSDNLAALQAAISSINPQWQGLNTFLGIQDVTAQFTAARPQAQKVVILVTNAISSNPTTTIAEATTARAAGIKMVGASFMGQIPVPELILITADSSLVFVSPNTNDLVNTISGLVSTLCPDSVDTTTVPTDVTDFTTDAGEDVTTVTDPVVTGIVEVTTDVTAFTTDVTAFTTDLNAFTTDAGEDATTVADPAVTGIVEVTTDVTAFTTDVTALTTDVTDFTDVTAFTTDVTAFTTDVTDFTTDAGEDATTVADPAVTGIVEVTTDVTAFTTDVTAFTTDVTDVTTDVTDFTTDVTAFTTDVTDFTTDAGEDATTVADPAVTGIVEVTTDVTAFTTDVTAFTTDVTDVTTDVTDFTTDVTAFTTDVTDFTTDAGEDATTVADPAVTGIVEVTMDVTAFTTDVTDVTTDVTDFTTDVTAFTTDVTAFTTDVTDFTTDAGEDATTVADPAVTGIVEVTTDVTAFTTDVTDVTTDVTDFTTDVTDFTTDVTAFTTDVTDFTTDAGEDATTVADPAVTGIVEVTTDITAFTTDVTDVTTDVTDFTTDVTAFTTDVTAFTTDVTDFTTDAGEDATTVADPAVTGIVEVTTDVTAFTTDVTDVTTDVKDVTTDVTDFTTDVTAFTTDVTAFTTDAGEGATTVADPAVTGIVEVTTDVTAFTTDVTDVTTDVTAFTTDVTAFTTDITAFTTDVTDFTTDAGEDATTVADPAVTGIVEVTTDVTAFTTDVTDVTTDVTDFTTDVTDFTTGFTDFTTDVTAFTTDAGEAMNGGLSGSLSDSAAIVLDPCVMASADVVLMVDDSDSLKRTQQDGTGVTYSPGVVRFIKDVNALVNQGDIRIALLMFSDTARLLSNFEASQALLDSAIDNLSAEFAGTNGSEAFLKLQTLLSGNWRAGVERHVIFIVDSVTDDPAATLASSTTVKDSGINVITVGFSDAVSPSEMAGVASSPNQTLYVSSDDQLSSLVPSIKAFLCTGVNS